jgi:PAS domain S-box-containing protein
LPGLGRSIFEGSPLPIATLAGSNHIVRYANSAFCQLAGKSKDELIGSPLAEILPGGQTPAILDRVYRTGEAETNTEPEDSEARPAYRSYVMWPILGGDERQVVGIVFQVTETARFHQQATAMNQELLQSALRQHELTEEAERLNA